jgi:hypothetical protein
MAAKAAVPTPVWSGKRITETKAVTQVKRKGMGEEQRQTQSLFTRRQQTLSEALAHAGSDTRIHRAGYVELTNMNAEQTLLLPICLISVYTETISA